MVLTNPSTLLKTYFAEHGLPDDEIAQQANKAKEVLGGLDLGARIRDRLLGSIGGLLNNSSPKGALYHLAQKGIINKTMADKWVKLRLAFAFCSQKSVRNGPILGPGSCDFSYLADLPISEQVGTQDVAFTLTAT